jgi:hypothetical protein
MPNTEASEVAKVVRPWRRCREGNDPKSHDFSYEDISRLSRFRARLLVVKQSEPLTIHNRLVPSPLWGGLGRGVSWAEDVVVLLNWDFAVGTTRA